MACCCQASFRAFRRLASDVEGGFELEGDAGQGLRERIMDLDGQFCPFLDFQACARMGDLFLCEPSRAPAGDGLDRAVPDDAGGEDAEQDADDDQEFRVRPPRQLRAALRRPQDARQFRRRGSEWTERNLFNGAYYEQRVTPPRGPIAAGLQVHARAADALADPDFQLGAGCLVDQLLGDYAAQAVGLRPVADDAHARTALATVLARCRQRSDGTFNPMRSYALGDEVSLKMAWYPEDRFPRSPFPYYRETMTGFEYVVAALLAWRGDRAEAERVVRDVRSRYDGRKRNPFDEAECGHHYARALAAWTVLKAMDPGFEVTNTLNKKGSPVP